MDSTPHESYKIVIGKNRVDANSVCKQLKQEIHLLEEQVKHLQKQTPPDNSCQHHLLHLLQQRKTLLTWAKKQF